jgi:hypothetical protein
LNAIRTNTSQAMSALAVYAPASDPAFRGEMQALRGVAEVMLADLFCSGIPLSTVQFDGDQTYAPGSTTSDVYLHAIALFDSAIAMAGDSARIVNLARVGKGRALLDLGRLDDAAATVHDVPDDFVYRLPIPSAAGAGAFINTFNGTVADVKGVNGLPYRSSQDPRSAVRANGANVYHVTMYAPKKYDTDASPLTVTIASGVEARLIEAEAALHDGDDWLDMLNALRTDGTYTVTGSDTTWHAGTGGVAGLKPLTDPGSDTARVATVFTERAYWLFLTGHRQGDLRRLIRQYDRAVETVYSVGPYNPDGYSSYGTDINAPVPQSEQLLNPQYDGCFNRGA